MIKLIKKIFKSKINFLDWDIYKFKIETISEHRFQQDCRKKSLKNKTENERFFY